MDPLVNFLIPGELSHAIQIAGLCSMAEPRVSLHNLETATGLLKEASQLVQCTATPASEESSELHRQQHARPLQDASHCGTGLMHVGDSVGCKNGPFGPCWASAQPGSAVPTEQRVEAAFTSWVQSCVCVLVLRVGVVCYRHEHMCIGSWPLTAGEGEQMKHMDEASKALTQRF
jgi:hypothetical protein